DRRPAFPEPIGRMSGPAKLSWWARAAGGWIPGRDGATGEAEVLAAELEVARHDAGREAERLRHAVEAVSAIAREARVTHEPAEMFEVVAAQVRRITGCELVALAVPGAESGTLEIAHVDAPASSAGIAP